MTSSMSGGCDACGVGVILDATLQERVGSRMGRGWPVCLEDGTQEPGSRALQEEHLLKQR